MSGADRALTALAGVAGVLGVALSARAAHAEGGGSLDVAARFLLIHAAALLGLAALIGGGALHPRLGRIAAWVLVAGLALFCGDLSMRVFRGVALFPFAAPAGGIGLMAGWAMTALAALVRPRR
ncbi:DUF423 domain-containing protein [Salinarimonas soli]|uniref:DUF423 domain-containing protein n=1 Tax=Salinarimonas soli TaxID=1638099 RepID=A0A5B2VHD7_9HYPH|nr:DUF423 domain-containing protein [Salinarimonas soli]KAA2238314.1 DUF423 domain-containing protein [Salinarimonas soli]